VISDKLLEYLIARGADVNARDSNDCTPLHIHASTGQHAGASPPFFASNKTDAAARDWMGYTQLHEAVRLQSRSCDGEVVRRVEVGGVPSNRHRTKDGWTPLELSVLLDRKEKLIAYLHTQTAHPARLSPT